MSKPKSLALAGLLITGMITSGFLLGGGQISQARVDDRTTATGQAAVDPLRDMTEDMKVNHGKYDNALTAMYEQKLAGFMGGATGSASAFAPLYGADVRMSNSSFAGNQNEFQIDINPTNSLFAIGTSNDGRTAGVGIYRTSDGGVTWAAQDAPIATSACCDPAVAYAYDGTVYVGVLDTSPAVQYVIKSTDNGVTWSSPVTMVVPDRNNLVVDNGITSPRRGTVYTTYSDLSGAGFTNRIKGYKSTDGGATWGSSFFVGDVAPAAGYEQSSQPRVASDGTLYVGYQQYTNSGGGCAAGVQNVLAKSTDGGATFTWTVLPITQGGACVPSQAGRGIFCVTAGGANFRSRSHPIIGVHPTNPNIVYMVYSGGDLETAYTCSTGTGFHSDTLFRKSTDGGATFSAPSKINGDGTGFDQYYPWVDVAPNGTIWAGWNDRRDDPNNLKSKWYQAYSTDQGATWNESAVADVQTQPSTFIGDYHGIAAENDRVLGMWYDSRLTASGDPYTDPDAPIVGGSTPTPTSVPATSTSTATTAPTNTPTSPPATATSTGVVPTNTSTSVPATATSTTAPATATAMAGSATATPTACTLSFTDVPVGSTFYPFIRCLACMGIINGYPEDNTFRPNNNVTRGQLAKIVSNSAGFTDPAGAQIFEDVLPDSTFYDFIQRLASRNYMSGYPCGGVGEPCVMPDNRPYFRSNSNATRGQISKIVANAAGFVEPAGAQMFEDVLPGSTFYDFIQRLASRNIINGYPCGNPGEPCGSGNLPYFRPSANATRGQTSKIVSNTFFPDCNPPAKATR
ncbi:MAG: S-layer homology domain-containing protein [Chloroflexota bacterium]